MGDACPHRDLSAGWSDEKGFVSANKSLKFRPNIVLNCDEDLFFFFLFLVFSFILPFTEHAYIIRMRISATVFLRLTKNKTRTRYAYFSGIYKGIYCIALARVCLVQWLWYLSMTLSTCVRFPTKSTFFLHKRNRLFFAIIFEIFCFDVFT